MGLPGDRKLFEVDSDFVGYWLFGMTEMFGDQISTVAGHYIDQQAISPAYLNRFVERMQTWPYDVTEREVSTAMRGNRVLWAPVNLRANEMIGAFTLLRLAGTQVIEDSASDEASKLRDTADRMESVHNSWFATRGIWTRVEVGAISSSEADAGWQELQAREHFVMHPTFPFHWRDCG